MIFPNSLLVFLLVVTSLDVKNFVEPLKTLEKWIGENFNTNTILSVFENKHKETSEKGDVAITPFKGNEEETNGDLNLEKDTISLEPNPENENENSVESDAETKGCSSGAPSDICDSLAENSIKLLQQLRKIKPHMLEEKEIQKLKMKFN